MTKRYLVFAGENFYPDGGWDDIRGSFDTQEEAERFAHGITGRPGGWDWGQVVDLMTGAIVSRRGKPLGWSGHVGITASTT